MENKIVVSIAIRLPAEKFMVSKLSDPAFVAGIDSKQTSKLLGKFAGMFQRDRRIEILQRVVLMTPENIHVNAFMYEPILDMSDEHLRKLHRAVCSLQ